MRDLTLAMIVKNENTDHFRQCLESVCSLIDYYIICDNGSTDGTQQMIKEFFEEKGIEGEVHDVEWVNFGYNRTEALKMCEDKTKYILMVDADDYIVGKPDVNISRMDEEGLDGYGLRIKRGEFTWWRNQIFRASSSWSYKGVLHEYAHCDKQNPVFGRILGDYHIEARTLGARNKKDDGSDLGAQEKYSRDAEILEKALNDPNDPAYEPDNSRYQFYLAQSYFDSQQYDKAEEAYKKRASMGGWKEEVFYSIFRVAICKMLQNQPWPEVQDNLLQAWNFKPDRAEPLHQLARIHRLNGNPNLGYMFAKIATDIKYPQNDILFISEEVYSWLVIDEFAATAYYVNDFENGFKACNILMDKLNKGIIPKEHEDRIKQNFQFYKDALLKERTEKINKDMERKAQEKSAPVKKYKKKKGQKASSK